MRGLDLHGPQQVDLGLGLRESIEDPAVHLAVALLQPLLDEGADDVVWDHVAAADVLVDDLGEFGALLHLLLDQLLNRNIDEAVNIRQHLSLSGFTRTWWPDEHNIWHSSSGLFVEM